MDVKQFFKKKIKIKTQTRKVTNSQEDIIVTVIDTETKEEVCRLIVKKINSIYKICLENHVEDQKLFNEIMDEAERLNPQPELTGCPCNTCIYDEEVCELENLEPHTSRLLQICYDYDEGEEENEY